MKLFTYLIYVSELALLYNFLILLSVTLNLDWVRTRAAGGQYETFPVSLRIIYFLMAAFMITLAFWLWDCQDKVLDSGNKRLVRILGFTFLISTFLQLLSKSPDERWNAIPAMVLSLTMFRIG